MANKTKRKTISRLLSKGLTGWEAGKLIIQDSIDSMCGKVGLLTDMDISRIDKGLTTEKDIRDYNKLMAANRNIDRGQMISRISSFEACLELSILTGLFKEVCKKNTVDMFMAWHPQSVTARQYQDIVADQRKVKLSFEFCLEYVTAERAVQIAPDDTEYVLDSENVKEQCPEVYKKALRQILRLYTDGKLKAVWYDKDKMEPLLAKQKKNNLSDEEADQLLDMLYVTGQQLYECDELKEWKEFIDNYQRYWHDEEDKRFRNSYAIVQEPNESNLDENGYYKHLCSPSEWITKGSELAFGLRAIDGEKAESVEVVKLLLLEILKRIKLNIRSFLAMKAIIDTSSEAIGIKFPDKAGGLDGVYEQLKLYTEQYNHNLERLKEGYRWSDCKETRLEKVLKALFPIDMEKLMPSAASIKWLEENVIDTFRDECWLRERMFSLEYDDGFSFRGLLENG